MLSVPIVYADGFPPYWNNSTSAVHWSPVNWPADTDWISYTHQMQDIKDLRTADLSNGGTAPQNYANISSSCDSDGSQPSISWAYDDTSPYWSPIPTFFFRWRVEQIANTYATGPSPGLYSNIDPWKCAQWTVLMDINGDGFYDFAVNIDGCSGLPATSIDVIKSIYNTTKSQSVDVTTPGVYSLFHNPTAFVESSTSKILNFRNSLSPTTDWPNGSAETVWDYGTTRATNITYYSPSVCNEYVIDYQIPLAMLDASSVGGPTMTADTPFCMAFVTANSNINPLQKDVGFDTSFLGDVNKCVPCGDLITASGGVSIPQPTVDWITATGCGPTTLTAQVRDAISSSCQNTLASVDFYYCYDENANGDADECPTEPDWTPIGAATVNATNPSLWTLTGWDTTGLKKGQYLIGVRAEDDQGNITWSHLTQTQLPGATPPNYTNPSPEPGVEYDIFNNNCGEYVSITKTASDNYVSQGDTVQFTITVTNQTSEDLTISSISDILPSNFTFVSTDTGAAPLYPLTIPPDSEPSVGATGTITWTYSTPVVISGGTNANLLFTADTNTVVEGTYTNVSTANTTEFGVITSNAVDIGVGAPQLTIAKSPSAYHAVPGDTITYTITYSNDSPVNTTGMVITDTLPAGLNFVAADNGGTYDSPTRTITWNLGSLASGEGPYTVAYQVTVDQGASVRTENTATIDSTETSPATATTAIYVPSPLQISKTANKVLVDPLGAAPANQVIFTISYQNTGTTGLTGATITDITMPGFTYTSCTGGCSTSGSCGTGEPCTVTWNIGNLAAGASGLVTLTLTVTNPYTETTNPATNTAVIDTNETGPFEDSASVLIRDYDCGATKDRYFFHDLDASALPEPWTGVFPGTLLPATQARDYANMTAPVSPTAIDITVNITDDSEMELAQFYMDPPLDRAAGFSITGTVDMQAYMSKNAGGKVNVTCYLYDYNPDTGESVQIGTQAADSGAGIRDNYLLTFSITPSGIVRGGNIIMWRFTTQRSSSYTGPVSFHYDSSATTGTQAGRSYGDICFAPLSITIDKTVDKLEASAGDSLAYTMTFSNSGQQPVTEAIITDTLPDGVTYVDATLNGAAATPVGGTCTAGTPCIFDVRTSDNPAPWPPSPAGSGGTLSGGQSGTLVINVTINNPLVGITTLTNIARLSTADTDPEEDAATTDINHTPTPDVFLQKSADKTLLNPNDTVTYTITVVNVGDATANNIVVSDIIPSDTYFTYVAGSIAGGNSRSDAGLPTLTWTVTSLAPGSSETLTFRMIVASSGVPSGVTYKDNSASATEGPRTTNSNTVTVAITTNANIAITKVSNPASGPVNPGITVQYTLTVTSNGGSTATGVVVNDPIPAGASYVSGTLLYDGASRTDQSGDDNAYYDAVANRVVFNLSNMTVSPDTSHTLKFSVLLDNTFADGSTTVTNTGTASATNTSSKSASAAVVVAAEPNFTLSKSAPSLVPYPLATLNGNHTATTTLNLNNLPGSRYFTVGDRIYVNGLLRIVTSIISATQVGIDLAITAGSGTSVIPVIKYSLYYANTGAASTPDASVKDILPPNLNYLAATPTPTTAPAYNTNGILIWSLGTLSPGAGGSIIVYTRPTAIGTYSNTATMSASTVSEFASNTVNTTVGALELDKSTTTSPVVNNPADGADYATYVIRVRNPFSATTALGIQVTDQLPQGFTYFGTTSIVITGTGSRSAIINPPGGATNPTWGTWTLGANSTLTITFTALVDPTVNAGTYQNGVTATSTNLSVLPFDEINTTAEDITVTVPNDLRVTKAVQSFTSPCTPPACQVTYLITVTNVGTASLNNIIINDVLPVSLTWLSDIPSQGSYIPATGNWSLGAAPALALNNSATLQITASVNSFTADIRNCASLTGSNPADTNTANNTGCTYIMPTFVTLSDFRAYEENGKVVIEWSTASELNTAGFYLFRLDESTGDYIRINKRLLPSLLTSPIGGTYSLIDKGASPQGRLIYILVEIEGKGTEHVYGPFTVHTDGQSAIESLNISDRISPEQLGICSASDCSGKQRNGSVSSINTYYDSDGSLVITNKDIGTKRQQQTVVSEDLYENYTRKAPAISDEKKARIQSSKEQRKASIAAQLANTSDTAKISVTEHGLYYLDVSRIASLFGVSVSDAKKMMIKKKLALSNQGQNVSYLPAEGNTGIYFYGEGINSNYTEENIYWLGKGTGQQMRHIRGRGPNQLGNGTFTNIVHAEEDKILAAELFMNPESDFWVWDYVIGEYSPDDVKNFSITAKGVYGGSATATLNTYLQGFTSTQHHAIISINGQQIGEDQWVGNTSKTIVLTFPQALLSEGVNNVQVKAVLDTGVPYSVFYVDSFDLSYQRLYKADGNSLLFKGDGNPIVTVEGFINPQIMAFDVTDPLNPKLNTATTIGGTAGNYRVSLVPATPDTTYLAISPTAAITGMNAWADTPSNLSSPDNRADYIIIAPEGLAGAENNLAFYRHGKGLVSMVVKLEDIMDEFNYGISSPEAIHAFLSYAYQNWSLPPRYVVLAGDGSYDYKNNLGFGENLIPVMLSVTPFGLFPSDNLFADVDGDHVPEMAVGRLPVLTAQEMQNILNKIISYETNTNNRIIMLSDNADDGGNFPADSDYIAGFIPLQNQMVKVYLYNPGDINTVRQTLLNEMNNGAFLMNYLGHAGYDLLAYEGLLSISNLGSLNNLNGLPVLTAMTCLVGMYGLPGHDTLTESLVLKSDGGAVATWSPTGLSYNFLARVLDEEFFKGVFSSSGAILGDVILNALEEYHSREGSLYMLDIYNLLGDPALKVR